MKSRISRKKRGDEERCERKQKKKKEMNKTTCTESSRVKPGTENGNRRRGKHNLFLGLQRPNHKYKSLFCK